MTDVDVVGYRYAVVPEWILDAEISERAIRLFAVLSRYVGANEAAWPSRKHLANRMNCSARSVTRAIAELEEIGAVKSVDRHREDGSQASSFYYLWPHPLTNSVTPPGQDSPAPYPAVSSPLPTTVQPLKNINERTLMKDISSKKVNKKNDYSEDFEVVWRIYPRRDNKIGGYKAYCASLNKGALKEDLLLATKKYSESRVGKDETFTLYAKTFFGPSERWREFLPISSQGAYKLLTEELVAAQIYKEYDEMGFWFDNDGVEHQNNPAINGFERPVDNRGRLVDIDGRVYKINTASGKRVYE